MANLRQRNRARAMRELQTLALSMFDTDGFDAVTVEELAEAGGVSASTVYRYFGTKERLVTWDETDRDITTELTRRLGRQSPVVSFRDALIAVYADEEANVSLLRRVRFIYANPQVHAAAIEQDLNDRNELAAGFAIVAGRKSPSLADDTQAGVCMAALDAAIDHWQRPGNELPLHELITRAFAVLDD